jgi:hypothetical protein
MASCCCWFIQPAIAMRTNRKGSRTFVVLASKGYYAPGGRSVRIQIFQRDRISGHNEVAAKLCLVSLAEALSRPVPDTDCRVIL